uniref:Ig-like domain-containing protein n=1 Tax=Chelydra serpentina TaxID=8475 RepID=A0A8C3SKQ1_CHESE
RSACITYESNPAPLWSNFLCVSVPLTVNFKVIGPDHPITVSAGEDALLPCHLSPNMSAQEMEVRWLQSKFSELVHLYEHGKDHTELQISKYRGRTELLKDDIMDGRVALHIRNITPYDQGQFICFFRSPSFHGEATLELKVTAREGVPWVLGREARVLAGKSWHCSYTMLRRICGYDEWLVEVRGPQYRVRRKGCLKLVKGFLTLLSPLNCSWLFFPG